MVKKNILVIAAHPDDEVLGCGGTIIKYSQKYNVFSVIVGKGYNSRINKKKNISKDLKLLKQHANKAAKIMGVKKTFFLSLPDNKLDTLPLLEIIQKIESIINKVKPEIIYTHHHGDLNIDHQIINKAVLTATRPTNKHIVKSVRTFEILSSSEWNFQNSNKKIFKPNLFIDITNELEKKIESFLCYKTEVKSFPHPRSKEGIKHLARLRGTTSGMKAAECFYILRSIEE